MNRKSTKIVTIIEKELRCFASETRANQVKRFFKTGKGEYGEDDAFLGVSSPNIRKVAKTYMKTSSNDDIEKWHEIRLFALIIITDRAKKTKSNAELKVLYDIYMNNRKYINSWDLVDISAPHVVGRYLNDKDRSILYELSSSESVWDRRIAILSTFYMIKEGDYCDTIELADRMKNDNHDLIHKAVGWMIREIGRRDFDVADEFVRTNAAVLPRTMLRYAIEQFPNHKRQTYMAAKSKLH